MTTLNSASANTASARHRAQPLRALTLVAFAALALAGCESSSNILPEGGSAAPNVAVAPTPGEAGATQSAKIQIAPIIGSPEGVARELQTQLTAAIERRNITVAKTANSSGEYVLRGYIVAAREKTGAKVSYIWDVTDQTGTRVHRITGEEAASGAATDPWSAVTPQIVQNIADRTASQIATWLPGQSAASSVPIAGAPTATGANQIAAATPDAAAPSSASTAPLTTAAVPSAPAAPTTGSIEAAGPVTTFVPQITGAPGDGGATLTSAIQRELSRNGVTLTQAASPQTYKVEGKVAMGQAKDGKQPIQIDWNVLDPKGKKLGTVSQKNEVPQGSLDGAWGKTADAAAAAAAQGILKLLPQKTAAN
ncbi:MAG: hypothetical protein ACT4OU_07450 [Hyphomicrobium sp.]